MGDLFGEKCHHFCDSFQRKEHRWHHEQSSDVLAVPSENGTFLEHCDGDAAKKDADGSGSSDNSIKCTLQPSPGVIYESQEQAINASFGHQEVLICTMETT